MRKPRTFRSKLIASFLLTTFVALVVALASMIGYDLYRFHTTALADMQTHAELIARTTAPALAFDDPRMARENLSLLRLRPTVRAAAIFNERGQIFATYVREGDEEKFPPAPTEELFETRGQDLYVFKQVIEKGEVLGTIYIHAEFPIVTRVETYVGIASLVTVVAMLVAFAFSTWIQAAVTNPISDIANVARDVIAHRTYERRAQVVADDELGALASGFNNMLAEIQKRADENARAQRNLEREILERRRSEQEVVHLNEVLESRVLERTAQLEESNRDLAIARKEAERANLAKSDFLSSMSHELRTPLNAILGFGQLLASETLVTTPEQKKSFVDYIVKAGRHLLDLINDILDLTKIESGYVALSLEPVVVSTLLQECHQMVEPLARQRGVRMQFPVGEDVCVFADRTRLKQILLNLLSNSIKYNKEGGSVFVSCRIEPSGQAGRVTVQDTGMGIRPDLLAELFQPFNRLGQEAGTVEGTGIGLVVTKRLVELMGGGIHVESTLGVGSTFAVEMPATKAPPQLQSGIGLKVPRGPVRTVDAHLAATVLYVEDNPANLVLVEEMLRFRPELQFLSAPDAVLGIELARAHRPRVILMDINLAGMSGTDALKMLRETPETANIPVVAITANATQRDVEKGLADGFFRYVTKPLVMEEFMQAIECALELTARPED
jgi:signal transduction histidine kinase/ActR/RegA family two-component response regulator